MTHPTGTPPRPAPYLRRGRARPLVTLCVPAYRAAPFLRRCLESALAQTMPDLHILIANDGGYDAGALAPWRGHPRVTVLPDTRRRGWVANTNALIARVRSPFFAVLPQDDLLRPTYLEATLSAMADPDAAAAYSDILSIDLGNDRRFVNPAAPVPGDLPTRLCDVLRRHYNGYIYRGLIRRRPGQDHRMMDNPHFSFAVDSTWIMQNAIRGPLVRVAEPLYVKHYHPANTHMTWRRQSPGDIGRAWATHCGQITGLAMGAVPTPDLRAKVWSLGLDRMLLPERAETGFFPAYLPRMIRPGGVDAAVIALAFRSAVQGVAKAPVPALDGAMLAARLTG